MRFKLLLFVFLTAFLSKSFSQPQISYIIPDIGAPGMSVYVEFIGPYNKKGNFGDDGFYINDLKNKVTIELADKNDSNKVIIGPSVVSWDGRMISATLFVNHLLNPNSEDALLVTPEFQIELKIKVGNEISNSVTFYIVKSRPFLDCTLFPNDSIFGEGNLGKRSPRGALIFDSIKLGEKKYRFSVKEPIPNKSENQNFLPVNLLVKGSIRGTKNKSILSVNGGDNLEKSMIGMVQDAGPGGGGGGGSFRDAGIDTDLGYRGGHGFIGGGPGGRNKNGIPFVTDDHTKPPSQGSGPYLGTDDKNGGFSLNGNPGPRLAAYESAGGATGHPFGTSGEGCGDGNSCQPLGGYGGGSGYKQNSPGGSGGYATDGSGSLSNGGMKHGNIMVVPVAGGSGGAGGNPNCFPPGMSGAGGGGGGAIRVFANVIDGVTVSASGAKGADNGCSESWGGSGSGGHVGIQTKIAVFNTSIAVIGGSNSKTTGGSGRARFDTPNATNFTTAPNDASVYEGPTTDTTSWIKKNHILTGSQGIGRRTILYMRGKNSSWTTLGTVTNKNWTFDLSPYLNSNEKVYYLVAATEVENPKISSTDAEPHQVFSQAAANIFFLDIRPYMKGDTLVKNKTIHCYGDSIYLTAHIINDKSADANLEFDISNSNWLSGNNGFEIIGPLGKYILAPDDTMEILVKFKLPVGFDPKQPVMNYLLLPSNDPDFPAGKDWKILFEVSPALLAELSYDITQNPPFIFDDTRLGKSSFISYDLINTGDSKLRISSINPLNQPFELVSTNPALPVTLDLGQKLTINLKFTPKSESEFNAIVTLNCEKTDTTCFLETHTEVKGTGIKSNVNVNKFLLDYGKVAWCKIISDTIKVVNPVTSTSSFQITMYPKIIGKDSSYFKITKAPQDSTPVLTPDGTGVQYVVTFFGDKNSTGLKTATFYFTTDDPDADTIKIELKAEIVPFDVTILPDTLDLGTIATGFIYNNNFNLTNNGKLDELIGIVIGSTGIKSIIQPTNDSVLANGGTNSFGTVVETFETGTFVDSVKVIFYEPCPDTVTAYVKYRAVNSNPYVLVDVDPIITNLDTNEVREVNLGDYPICALNGIQKILEFDNLSEAPYIVLDEFFISNSTGRFIIDPNNAVHPDTVYPNQERLGVILKFNPLQAQLGDYSAVLGIKLYVNGIVYLYKINLKASVYQGLFTITPNPVTGEAIVGTSEDFKFTVTNLGPINLDFVSHTLPFNSNIFEILPNPDGISIPIGQSKEFTIRFKPNSIIVFKDSIKFAMVNSLCDTTYTLFLEAKGTPSKIITVWIPELITTPDLDNYKIPIYGKFDKKEDILDGIGIGLRLNFNRTLFYPAGAETGSILKNEIIDSERSVTLEYENISLSSSDSLIGFIYGYTLLGDSVKTALKIDSIYIKDEFIISSIKSVDGSLTIEVCEEGGERLLKHNLSPLSLMVNPNPVKDLLRIKVNTLEKGRHQISIVDIHGRKSILRSWDAQTSGLEFEFNENIDFLMNGIYFLEITSPSNTKFHKFSIIK